MCIMKTPKMPSIKADARSILPESPAKTPDSPQLGDETGGHARKKRATGKKSLIISPNGSGAGLNI